MELQFSELSRLLNPAQNPNVEDAQGKVMEAMRYRDNPEVLWNLALSWGIVEGEPNQGVSFAPRQDVAPVPTPAPVREEAPVARESEWVQPTPRPAVQGWGGQGEAPTPPEAPRVVENAWSISGQPVPKDPIVSMKQSELNALIQNRAMNMARMMVMEQMRQAAPRPEAPERVAVPGNEVAMTPPDEAVEEIGNFFQRFLGRGNGR